MGMIDIFEIFWSAPIELRVIILGGLISPFILLRNTKKRDTIDLSEKNNCDICHNKDKLQYRKNSWYCPKCYFNAFIIPNHF